MATARCWTSCFGTASATSEFARCSSVLPDLHTDAATTDHQWRQWATAADDLDEFELALTLLDRSPEGLSDEFVAVERARLLLMLRRPVDGLAALDQAGIAWASVEGEFNWSDAVRAACQAAARDDESFRWLIWAASVVAGTPQAWRLTYLIAAAASQRSDQAVADQAWRQLVLEHRIFTRASAAEYAATEVALRDRSDAPAAIATLAGVATDLESLPTPVTADPGPLLLAVTRLNERGDTAGARLLLTAIAQRNSPSEAIQQALDAVTPAEAMRRHRTKVLLAWLPAPLLLVVGPLAWLIIFAVRKLWHEQVKIPGFTKTDGHVWRAFREVQYDAGTGKPRLGGHRLTRYHFVGFAVGGFGAMFSIPGALDLVAAVFPAERSEMGPWSLLAIIVVGATTLIAGCLAGHRVEQHLRKRATHARLGAEERRLRTLAAQCDCWQRRALSGRFAAAYWESHLQPVHDAPALDQVRRVLGTSAAVGACPTTGATWLGGAIGFGGGGLLLRGSGPEKPPTPDSAPRSDGFYL